MRAVIPALLLALGVLGATPPIGPSAAAAAAPPSVSPTAPREVDHRLADLSGDTVLPGGAASRATAGRFRIRFWPGRTVRYHETIPAKWQWSLDNAIDHWNGTGAGIKLVKVSSRKRAELTIGYGDTGGADGIGTLGYAPGPYMNFVRLSPRYKRVNENNPEQRVWVARLLAHEIGHNLGYDHTRGRCDLMAPIFLFGPCGPLSDAKPGYYRCRYIDTPLLTRHVRIYGGNARQPAKDCLIEPLPRQLADVVFSGGGDLGPVRISWRVESPPRDASIRVSTWPGTSCGAVPKGAQTQRLPISRTSWTDTVAGKDTRCYAVQVVNRFGAAQRPVSRAMRRWAPAPATPQLGPFTYRAAEQEFTFSYTPRPGISLAYQVVDLDPETGAQCATDLEGGVVRQRSPGLAAVAVVSLRACYTLWETNDFGDRSAPVFVTVEVPAPTATPTVGSVTRGPDGYAHRIQATLPAGSSGRIGISLVAGACADRPPGEPSFFDGYEVAADTFEVLPDAEGPHCALVAAVDGFGRHGPVVEHPFTVTFAPVTATPTVGPVVVEGQSARVQVSLASSTYRVGLTLVTGACPAQPPSDAQWWDGYQDFDVPDRWWVDVWEPGQHCLLVAAVDDRGRHGPVVARPFTVAG